MAEDAETSTETRATRPRSRSGTRRASGGGGRHRAADADPVSGSADRDTSTPERHARTGQTRRDVAQLLGEGRDRVAASRPPKKSVVGRGAAGAVKGGTTGAAAGAAIGSIVPGVGTAVGGVVGGAGGAALGGAGGAVGAARENAANRPGYQKMLVAEFLVCIVLTALSPIADTSNAKDFMKRGSAVFAVFLILGVVSGFGEKPGKVAAALGGLITLGLVVDRSSVFSKLVTTLGSGAEPAQESGPPDNPRTPAPQPQPIPPGVIGGAGRLR